MSLISLKAHILLGATLWTIGLVATSGVLLHAIALDRASAHVIPHSAAQVAFRLLFLQYAPATALVGAVCMYLGFVQVRRGLSPINELRSRLAAVHRATEARVGGSYPVEVQPLVDDLNALLEERERRVARAVARSGDLAHGLK